MMAKYYKNKKILITGGLGFIGSTLAIRLVEEGAKVVIVDALISGYGGNRFNIEPVKEEVKVVIADIREGGVIDRLVTDKDIIFNLAGTLSHIDSMMDPMTDLEINCRAQLSLLESVRKYNPKVRIIFAGTRNQYGKARYLPVDENHPQEPTDINGINSIAAEKYHLMYTKVYGIKTVSLRMTNTYGPRHQMKHSRQGVLNWFLRLLMEEEEIKLYGGGKQIRDVNYIDDVVGALLTVGAAKRGWGEAYNLGGAGVSLYDFVQKAIKINGRGKVKTVPFPNARKKIEVGDYIASYEKITKTYGWKPQVSLDAGIKKTFEYYRKYKKYYW
ncbi:NAD-dependent epimerase [Candidatus Gottesmanbacteria bacterium RIFCSPHIGHO2_02_FULL_39_14]|uniref:NAD-dependent epimerase n=1 Tax=Candidatus Gottesmanbacteria bacterium RIFCSPHIGHO2_02_FULL_39_14 TaxID=1798383 RepID=A0A1F5ZYQ9_9BACT|nr:MAG: NAD-dependent epimerase [Candidatus Gottesmanbacteria bacterium RIFCSPHIGHO2_02_FULL_39_14]